MGVDDYLRLPLLPAKQRALAEGDWMARDSHVACPDPEERVIDLRKPLYFTLYGEWTKQSGYARLRPQGRRKPLVQRHQR